MPRRPDVCSRCDRGCDIPCEALEELRRIYSETRTREKRQLICRLRKQLDIVDAETAIDLKEMAGRIIKKLPELRLISDFDIKIGYVRSFERKTKDGKYIYADCRKVNKVYGAYLPFDFIITFYEPNIGHLTDNQLKILMWHELKHIGIGERGFIVTPHDIEDFFTITDAHGTRWDDIETDVVNILE